MKVPLNLKAVKASLLAKPNPAEQSPVEVNTLTEETPVQNRSVSLAEVQQHWQAFFIQLKNNNGSPIEMMLAGAVLELRKEHEVSVLLSSSLQEEPFERLKPKVQHYLRQQLQNSQLSLHSHLAEESGPRRLYTNNEKFQHLMQRYPLLGELKERLGLEADF